LSAATLSKETIEAFGNRSPKERFCIEEYGCPAAGLFLSFRAKHVFKQEGIDVENSISKKQRVITRRLPFSGRQLSPPLSEIVKPLLKDSQNLYAETLVRAMGLALKNEGSFAKGKEIVEEILEKAGIKKKISNMPTDRAFPSESASPDTLAKVLKHMKPASVFFMFL